MQSGAKLMYELHLHIDGSIRRSTFLELAKKNNVYVPENFGFTRGMSLREALSMFDKTVSVMQQMDVITRVTREICDDIREDGVVYAELRFAPQLHSENIEEVVKAAIAGLKYNFKLILCGLYGQNPKVIESLVDIAKKYKKVVGIDIAGGPRVTDKWGLHHYVDAYQEAKKYNIGRTIHVSEGRGPQEIIDAILLLDAQRLGHACSVLDNQEAMELVRYKRVVIEACPTSNVHTGIYKSIAEHPITEWIKNKLSVVICADNTLMSNVTTYQEIKNVREQCKLNSQQISWCYNSATLGRFNEKRITG
jgi:adenosine deaminase